MSSVTSTQAPSASSQPADAADPPKCPKPQSIEPVLSKKLIGFKVDIPGYVGYVDVDSGGRVYTGPLEFSLPNNVKSYPSTVEVSVVPVLVDAQGNRHECQLEFSIVLEAKGK